MTSTTKGDYSPLSSSSSSEKFEELSNVPIYPQRRESRVSLILQSATFLVAAVILTIVVFAPTPPSSTTEPPLTTGIPRMNPPSNHLVAPCGDNASTALANGCIFEVMSMAWVHPLCFDRELHDSFLSVASEPFFEDMAGTKPIANYEELGRRTDDSFTTRKYHIFHCSYSWRQVHRALDKGWNVDKRLAGYGHTEHCTKNLMNNSIPWEKVATRVNVVFPDC